MMPLPRELEKWLISLDLRYPIRRPKWDLANGHAVAEILAAYYHRKIYMDCYFNGLSLDRIDLNWIVLQESMEKLGVKVSQRLITGTRHFKDGAAELLLEELFQQLTGGQVNKVPPRHRVDLTDHAYQMDLPPVARSTASQTVKRNIRFSEIAVNGEPTRISWRASRILARHMRDRAAERVADPDRFDRQPSLAERAVRRSPPPVCITPKVCSSCSCCPEGPETEIVSNGGGDGDEESDGTEARYKASDNSVPQSHRKSSVLINSSVDVRQTIPPEAAYSRQCPESALHGAQTKRLSATIV